MKELSVIYCNGCSHTAGGGLELDRYLTNQMLVKDYYKEKYGVYWDNQLDITYPKYIADNLNADFVNEGASGGGTERVIRMTYDFVKKNWNRKSELFLILELPSLGRLDLFSKKMNQYIITNLHFSDNNSYNDDSIINMYGTRGYWNTEFEKDNEILFTPLKSYYDNFFSRRTQFLKVGREINTFFTYLKYHKIKFMFFTGEFSPIIETYLKEDNLMKLKVGNTTIEDFHEFAIQTKSTIAEECDFLTTDLHPGYFSHKNFGNLLSQYIDENYEKF